MADNPRMRDPFKAKLLTDDDVHAATEAYFAVPMQTVFLFGDSCKIDLAEAVRLLE